MLPIIEMDKVGDWSVNEMLKLSLSRLMCTTIGFVIPAFLLAQGTASDGVLQEKRKKNDVSPD